MSVIAPPDFERLGPPRGSRMVVVGGCGGIGRALVAAALKCRIQVAVLDLPESLAAHTLPEPVMAIQFEPASPRSVDSAFAQIDRHWGGVDVLVNLAGFTLPPRPVEAWSLEDWREVFEASYQSTLLAARAALPLLRGAGGGAIVHTASGLAFDVRAGYGPYASAKAGVVALTKALARENGPSIRANVIAPGAVRTEFLAGGTGRPAQPLGIDLEAYARGIPLGRVAEPDDVVGPILFLAGPSARFITGQVLHVNGGHAV